MFIDGNQFIFADCSLKFRGSLILGLGYECNFHIIVTATWGYASLYGSRFDQGSFGELISQATVRSPDSCIYTVSWVRWLSAFCSVGAE